MSGRKTYFVIPTTLCREFFVKMVKDLSIDEQNFASNTWHSCGRPRAITLQEERRKLEFKKRLTWQRLRNEQEAAEEKRKLDFEHQQRLIEVQMSLSSNPKNLLQCKNGKINHGAPHDWVRFWGQYEAEIHVEDVNKFSYLKELIDIKMPKLIDGIPFTREKYVKAIELLKNVMVKLVKLQVLMWELFLSYQWAKRGMLQAFILWGSAF